jgi:hypothetical protein
MPCVRAIQNTKPVDFATLHSRAIVLQSLQTEAQMPNPRSGENRDDWLERCMADPEQRASFPDSDQRYAVRVSKWDEKSMHYKSIPFELKREPDQDGTIEGYASIFDVVDSGMDVVAPGAFRKSIGSGRKVRMLWQHDLGEPIGVWDELREDDRGLYVKGRISKEVRRGAEAMALFRMGAMDSLSIGYRTISAEPEGGGRVRKITEAELWEVSAVTIPMNEHAIASVKSIDWNNKRDIEAGLRDVFGLSQDEAKAFIADGFGGLAAKRDVDKQGLEPEAVKSLLDQIGQLTRSIQNV